MTDPTDPDPDPDPSTLVDRLRADQKRRWSAGQPVSVSSYLVRYPEIEQDPSCVLDLIWSEYLIREGIGQTPDLNEYLGAFPELAASLRRQYQVHHFIERAGGSGAGLAKGDRPGSFGDLGNSAASIGFLPDFQAQGYEILEEIGRGGMGIVYRALDRRRRRIVALKVMKDPDPVALVRFKREFRALAEVSHPNLVTLHEFASDGRNWFFTMEWVDGIDLLRSIDGPRTREPSDDLARWARIRESFRQLAEGVVAMHASGMLHRDLKPSNVLVTREGRVVLLDFGLAAELEASGLHQSSECRVLGTIAYMAPEQAAGLPVSEASDWYSVGVMLYEALTGRTPFPGHPHQILWQKHANDPPRPSHWRPDLPGDLDALCADLIRRDAASRPRATEVTRRLGLGSPGVLPALQVPARHHLPRRSPLFGRDQHLEALAAALAAVRRGVTVNLLIKGHSGIGKSSLMHRFLDDLAAGDEVVILSGRCFESESVPYKAIDGLIDALARHLKRLPKVEAEALLPRNVASLAQVFPVLRNAEVVADSARGRAQSNDPQEMRRRAFAALRELLARIGDRHPLVLAIDDLQWGDADSAVLLSELMRPPDPPVFLMVGCYRSEDASTSPFLRAILSWRSQQGDSADSREIAVEPLSADESSRFALSLLGTEPSRGSGRVVDAQAIARESEGNPFFISELVEHLRPTSGTAEVPLEGRGAKLDDMLWSRIVRLPESARQLLEIVSVSGRPLTTSEACLAWGLGLDTPASLRSGKLIRGTGAEAGDEIETYHDRVRETVVAHLSPVDRKERHARLAKVLEATRPTDFETLAVHHGGAGAWDRASEFYARAAEQAAAMLAFDRATTLYRRVLEIRSPGDPGSRPLRIQLAGALANAGRGAEAAREYLATAAGAGPTEGLRLKQLAGYQLLVSGHVEEGLTILDATLRSMGSSLPASPSRALVDLVVARIKLGVRGLGFREREAGSISSEVLDRVDIARAIAVGLSVVDWIRGSSFQSRSLLQALRAGEASRIALTLAWEAVISACEGSPGHRRTARLIEAADALAGRLDHPHPLGMAMLARGAAEFLEGRFLTGLEATDRAVTILREHGIGVVWELDTAQIFGILCLFYSGQINELRTRTSRVVQEARERGDLYMESSIEAGVAFLPRLAADRSSEARALAADAIGRWTQKGFHFQHLTYFFSSTSIDLYDFDGLGAWRGWRLVEPRLRASQLMRIQFVRIDVLIHAGRAALAAAAEADDPRPFLKAASDYARRLERERLPRSRAMALLIRAGRASIRRETEVAIAFLRESVATFERSDMGLYAASARRRLGGLVGGDEGQALIARANLWMTAQGIRDPARMTACVAPGFKTNEIVRQSLAVRRGAP